jgi:hypothetical protein
MDFLRWDCGSGARLKRQGGERLDGVSFQAVRLRTRQ